MGIRASTIGFGAAIVAAAIVTGAQSAPKKFVQFTGVNLAGGEFAAERVPGRVGFTHIYPAPATIDYFAAKGMNIARFSVLWERMQYRLDGDLFEPEMRRIDSVIDYAGSKGMKVILDVHNYAAYRRSVIGKENVPVSAFADLWRRLATRYRDKQSIVFGLMHAPTGLSTEAWLGAANLAIAEIRKAQAQQLVLVPGNGFSSARDWLNSHYGTPNGEVMLKVADPANNYAYEVHQFFDENFAGEKPECQGADSAVETLKPFTDWARRHRKRGFLGQFGVGESKNCLEVLDRVLAYMAENNDVWFGWTYWAAGEWWPKDFFTSIQPADGQDRPQMAVLARYLKAFASSAGGKR